jgi:membrane-bound lytic murein transglycosylase B
MTPRISRTRRHFQTGRPAPAVIAALIIGVSTFGLAGPMPARAESTPPSSVPPPPAPSTPAPTTAAPPPVPAAASPTTAGGSAELRPIDGTGGIGYAARADVASWAREAAVRRGLDPDWVLEQVGRARFVPAVTRLIMPPPAGTAKDWRAYRARFIEPVRVRAGLAWWSANENWLERAEARWGVPAEIVAAIVGIETLYGRHMGQFRVIDTLATLAFDFPTGRRDRSGFFRDELERLLELSHREGRDPASWRGSFAGAMGLPQFMPSSLLRYGVDFDGDGRVDLQSSAADTVGSVANYLAEFGWRRGLPTVFPVAPPVETADRAALLGPDILPSFTPAQFAERGARLSEAAAATDSLLALVELQNGEAAPSYVAGTTNFYAITRYNWSSYYAMAVIDLATVLRERRAAR